MPKTKRRTKGGNGWPFPPHCVKPHRRDAVSFPEILVDQIRGNDDRFFVGCVACHLGLDVAHLKFAANCVACDPDLIEEISVLHAVEHELTLCRRGRGRGRMVQNSYSRLGVCIPEAEQVVVIGHILDRILSRGIDLVTNHEVKWDLCLNVYLLCASGRTEKERPHGEKHQSGKVEFHVAPPTVLPRESTIYRSTAMRWTTEKDKTHITLEVIQNRAIVLPAEQASVMCH